MTELEDAAGLYQRLTRVTPEVMRGRLNEAFEKAGFGLDSDGVVAKLPPGVNAAYHDLYANLRGLHTAQIAAKAALAGLGVYV